MYTNQIGIIDIIYKDSSLLLLKDIFYILGLRINLLSIRQVY